MSLDVGSLADALKKVYSKKLITVAVKSTAEKNQFAKYKHNPIGFVNGILGRSLTDDQAAILCSLPGRVKVNSGHSLGKTFVCACAVLWWFCTRDPAVVITTAPTQRDIVDLLWTEIRILQFSAKVKLPDHFVGPKAPEMFHHEEHWAKGYTASSGESLQGRHRSCMLFVYDECEGVGPYYWLTTNTMYQPGGDHGWIAIGNPVSTSSQSYLEDMLIGPDGNPKWKLFTLSALNHPNIKAELRGESPPYPNAVTLGMVEQWVKDWTTPLDRPEDRQATDIEWPPVVECPTCKGKTDGNDLDNTDSVSGQVDGSGNIRDITRSKENGENSSGPEWMGIHSGNINIQNGNGNGHREDNVGNSVRDCTKCNGIGTVGGGKWIRPGPSFKARVMGIRPTEGVDTVFSGAAWEIACQRRWGEQDCWLRKFGITIGVDAAGYGGDFTCFHVRSGPVSLYHESRNGWGPDKAAGRIKELCREFSNIYNSWAQEERPKMTPYDVKVILEFDGGYGIGVHSHKQEFIRWWGVTMGGKSEKLSPDGKPLYANNRAQAWLEAAQNMSAGLIDVSRLHQDAKDRLRLQLLTPSYEIRSDGSRLVESKDKVKERLGRSPDDADGLIISHFEPLNWNASVVLKA